MLQFAIRITKSQSLLVQILPICARQFLVLAPSRVDYHVDTQAQFLIEERNDQLRHCTELITQSATAEITAGCVAQAHTGTDICSQTVLYSKQTNQNQ